MSKCSLQEPTYSIPYNSIIIGSHAYIYENTSFVDYTFSVYGYDKNILNLIETAFLIFSM